MGRAFDGDGEEEEDDGEYVKYERGGKEERGGSTTAGWAGCGCVRRGGREERLEPI